MRWIAPQRLARPCIRVDIDRLYGRASSDVNATMAEDDRAIEQNRQLGQAPMHG